MGCAERERIAGLGDSILVEGSAERRRALAHSEGCPECRRVVAAIDPSLAVSNLPPVAVSSSEVETMKSHVLAARRMRRLDRLARTTASAGRRWAAVAALTVGILLVAEDEGRRSEDDLTAPMSAARPSSEDYSFFGALPLAGSFESSRPRIYQLDGEEDFSLIWIVDDAFEVSPR